MTYSISTDNPSGTMIMLLEHFASLGVELVSSSLSNGVLTVTTDVPLSIEQVEHLELTVL